VKKRPGSYGLCVDQNSAKKKLCIPSLETFHQLYICTVDGCIDMKDHVSPPT